VQIAAIYSSPMERAIETAEPAAASHGLQVQIVDDLNETDCGEWTGKTIEELAKTDIWPGIQHYPSGTAHPGGESTPQCGAHGAECHRCGASRRP
jgi:probable phosphoglycerate mutase